MTTLRNLLVLALCALAPASSAMGASAFGATVNADTPYLTPGAVVNTNIRTSTPGLRLDITVRIKRSVLGGAPSTVKTVTYIIPAVRRTSASRVAYTIPCPVAPRARYSATASVRVYNRAGRALGSFTATSGTSAQFRCA